MDPHQSPVFPQGAPWDIPHVPVQPAPPVPPEPDCRELPSPPDPQPEIIQSGTPEPSAQVRFLNAAADEGLSLRILTGSRLLCSELAPGAFSEAFSLPVGFQLFTFFSACPPWLLLHRSFLPLSSSDMVTLALVPSAGGLDLVRIDERPCGIAGTGRGCLRCVNLVYDSPGLDLVLTDGRVLFTDVRFKEATNYRRARPGSYQLYVAQTPRPLPSPYGDIETAEALPQRVSHRSLSGLAGGDPLCSFSLEVCAGSQSSIYLLGNWPCSPQLTLRVSEAF